MSESQIDKRMSLRATVLLLLTTTTLFVGIFPISASSFVVTTTTTKSISSHGYFNDYHPKFQRTIFHPTTKTQTCIVSNMVRNIDLAEAIIFYGRQSLIRQQQEDNNKEDNHSIRLLPGVENLITECIRDDTAILAILEGRQEHGVADNYSLLSLLPKEVQVRMTTPNRPPPNPYDLKIAIESIIIQPKGFGGSSGFGTKAADPERSPLPKHCVVLCHDENQCRAARYVGMRVLCLTDNDLADAVLDDDWSSICMDDIATPGSFWLNPPHPRDDFGNKVNDLDTIIQTYDIKYLDNSNDDFPFSSTKIGLSVGDADADNEMTDDELASILADIDPL